MMPEEEEYDIDLERELDKEHLLALVLQFEGITRSAAKTRLSVGDETIDYWIRELEEDGLLTCQDIVEDCVLEVTDQGMKRLADVGRKWITQQTGKEQETPEEEPEKKPKPNPRESVKKLVAAVKANRLDIILIASVLCATYLLKLFLDDPNMQVLSFLLAALAFSAALVLYTQYKKQLKTRKFLTFIQWLIEKGRQRRKYFIALLAGVLLVYAAGMLILDPPNKGFYVLLAVVVASTAVLFYSPKRDTRQVLLFYLGITLLTYGLLVVVDWMSVTNQLFNAKSRIIDFIVGLGLILLVYSNEDVFGVRGKKLLELH